jgi:DNA-binding MarR family transcriptional regulator
VKLEVVGLHIARRRRRKPSTASIRQYSIVEAVVQHPGLNINTLEEHVHYSDKPSLERALQGLIGKGYLRWEVNGLTQRFKYYATKEGQKWLAECLENAATVK